MGQDEGWNVMRRIVSPPAFPVCVRPFPPNGAEHFPSKNPSPKILKAAGGKMIVNPHGTALLAEQVPLERAELGVATGVGPSRQRRADC